MTKNVIKTLIFLLVIFLFIVTSNKLDLSAPLDGYEEFIVIDESNQYDLLRLADIDEEIVTYGFHAQQAFTISVEQDGEMITLIDYSPGSPIILNIDADDQSLVTFNISSDSTSDMLEVFHIGIFETYLERLFATNEFDDLMDNELYHKEAVLLDLLEGSIQAQMIAFAILLIIYLVFMMPIVNLFEKINLPRVKKWASRILLHILATLILYGLIIFILVTFWGEDAEYDVKLYEVREEELNLTTYLSLVKVNGLSKNALQVVYQFDLEEKGDSEFVGQLFCGGQHIERIYGYTDSSEMEHIYQDVFPADDCQQEDSLRLYIVNNKTGIIEQTYNDIPLYLDVDNVMEIYNLEDRNLGTYVTLGIILFCGMILVPIGEILIIKQEKKKKTDVSNT